MAKNKKILVSWAPKTSGFIFLSRGAIPNKIIMAENIHHLESKRVENSVFTQEIGGENGIFSKKRRSGDFGIFSNSTV